MLVLAQSDLYDDFTFFYRSLFIFFVWLFQRGITCWEQLNHGGDGYTQRLLVGGTGALGHDIFRVGAKKRMVDICKLELLNQAG